MFCFFVVFFLKQFQADGGNMHSTHLLKKVFLMKFLWADVDDDVTFLQWIWSFNYFHCLYKAFKLIAALSVFSVCHYLGFRIRRSILVYQDWYTVKNQLSIDSSLQVFVKVTYNAVISLQSSPVSVNVHINCVILTGICTSIYQSFGKNPCCAISSCILAFTLFRTRFLTTPLINFRLPSPGTQLHTSTLQTLHFTDVLAMAAQGFCSLRKYNRLAVHVSVSRCGSIAR